MKNISCKDLTTRIEHELVGAQKEENVVKINQILENNALSNTERVNQLSVELNAF